MDITYVPMARGFIYLAAVMDWFSRRVAQRRPPLIFVGWLTWVRALPARCNLQSFAQFISRLAVAASKPRCI
jgi:hypothetical protein